MSSIISPTVKIETISVQAWLDRHRIEWISNEYGLAGKAAKLCKHLESKHNKYMYIQDTWNLTKFSVPIFYIPFIYMTFPGLEMTMGTISK